MAHCSKAASTFSQDDGSVAPQDESIKFGAILNKYRKRARLTQKEMGAALHVSRATIRNWESDKSRPDYGMIPLICDILNVQVHELFQMRTSNGLNAQEERIISNLRKLSPPSRRVVDKMISTMVSEELLEKDRMLKETYKIFLIRPGTVAAGTGDFVPFCLPKYVFLRKNHINQYANGIVRVNGHSMEPVYNNDDYVYYKNASSACPGEDVIVDTEDGAVIKRVSDDYTLYSVNPDPQYAYPQKNDQNTLVIRGIVLGTVHSSDRAPDEDADILDEMFVDDIRAFYEERGFRV